MICRGFVWRATPPPAQIAVALCSPPMQCTGSLPYKSLWPLLPPIQITVALCSPLFPHRSVELCSPAYNSLWPAVIPQDELLNGDEEGVDCGGSCAPCPTCTDGIQNGDEEGIDCGVACQLMCRWPRSCLEMLLDQPSLPSGNYSIYPWRDELQEGAPRSPWQPDTIRPIPVSAVRRVTYK